MRRALLLIAAVLAIAGVIAGRALYSGNEELAASSQALDDGDPREAIVRARRSAGWYLPGAPHVPAAYARLEALARAAEEHRRDDLALLAWRSVRSAVIDTRAPLADRVAEADAQIARLVAKRPNAAEPDSVAMAAHLQELQRHHRVHPLWSLSLALSLLLGGAGFFMWSGGASDAAGKIARGWLSRSHARTGALMTLAGVALWLLSLWRA